MKKIFLATFIILFIFLGYFQISYAQESILVNTGELTPYTCPSGGAHCDPSDEACKQYCGDYGLNDFVLLVVKVSKIILGVIGALALGAFVIGGFMFLISGGSSERVGKAKQIIFGAVIGIIIVFGSYTIINFTLDALGYHIEGDARFTAPQ